ncbi:HAD family hydrolase [Paenibacillus sp. CC-CFT747]|nr:HAD family hydrolase [Paenibacillus sp. CC-CFT747]
MSSVQAVLFDLYETLISEYAGGSRKVSRESRDYASLLGLSNEEFKREWGRRHEPRMTGALATFLLVVQDILSERGLVGKDEVLASLYQERLQEKAVPFEDISEEIVDMLEGLKAKGLRLALISNCTEEEVRAWPASRIASYFDEILFSYEEGCAKPDRRIYERVCSRLQVRAEECLFVGDGGSNELDGAVQSGMKAYQACWFVPDSISGRISGYPKLNKPSDLLEQVDALM